MARGIGAFFMATLVMWVVSVLFFILFNNRTELLPIVAGFIFYQSANWVIRYFTSSPNNPLFVNTSVSLLHSSITSVSVLFILANQWIIMTSTSSKMFEHSQLVEHTWPYAYPVLCFSCGYFAYDQLDMLLYNLYTSPSILVHHLLLLVCFTLALYKNLTINYLILTLICELHSVFLHVRKVRRMAGFRDSNSNFVKVEWVLNWTSFVVARVGCHVVITVKLIRDASKFEKGGVELPLALFGMVGMNFLNAFLGVDLFNAYRREMNPLRTYQSHHD